MIKYDSVDQFANQVRIPFYSRGTIITGQDILRLAKTITGTGYQVDRYLTKGGFGSVIISHIFASQSLAIYLHLNHYPYICISIIS